MDLNGAPLEIWIIRDGAIWQNSSTARLKVKDSKRCQWRHSDTPADEDYKQIKLRMEDEDDEDAHFHGWKEASWVTGALSL